MILRFIKNKILKLLRKIQLIKENNIPMFIRTLQTALKQSFKSCPKNIKFSHQWPTQKLNCSLGIYTMGMSIRNFSSKSAVGLSGALGIYSGWLTSHPIMTKSVTSGIIVAAGDILAQKGIEKQPLDIIRVLRMGFLGAALIGPVLHVWYGQLHRFIPAKTTKGALQRLACDQLIFAPTFVAVFFIAMFGLEGRLQDVPAHLRENFLDTIVTNWMMWTPGNFVNFRFVPPQYQVLFSNFIALFWNTYLSWSGHQ